MSNKYLYNPQTHTLHITGYCTHAKVARQEYIPFDTEDDAIAYDGRAVGMCKLCQKAREKKMEEKQL